MADPTHAELETARAVAAELVEVLSEALNPAETWLSLAMARAALTHAMQAEGEPIPQVTAIAPDTGEHTPL